MKCEESLSILLFTDIGSMISFTTALAPDKRRQRLKAVLALVADQGFNALPCVSSMKLTNSLPFACFLLCCIFPRRCFCLQRFGLTVAYPVRAPSLPPLALSHPLRSNLTCSLTQLSAACGLAWHQTCFGIHSQCACSCREALPTMKK